MAIVVIPDEIDGSIRGEKDEDRGCGNNIRGAYRQDGAAQQSYQEELQRVFRPVKKQRNDDVDDGACGCRGPWDHELLDDNAVEGGAEREYGRGGNSVDAKSMGDPNEAKCRDGETEGVDNKERVNWREFIENCGKKGVSREIPVFGWA
jgi:hypothetical protein